MNKLKQNQKGFSLVEILLVILIIVMVTGIGIYVWQQNKKQTPVNSTTTSNSDPKKNDETSRDSAQTTNAKPVKELIDYGTEVEIQKKSDVSKLTDASDTFKNFIASYVEDEVNTSAECGNPLRITVSKVVKDEFAVGGIGQCGGAAYIWKKSGGVWAKVWAGQDIIVCDDVKKYMIPSAISEECLDSSNPNNPVVIKNTI